MGKPTICICENKGADQLRSNCEADQRLCFRYTDSKLPLLSKSKISSLKPSVTVQLGLCWTWSEPKLLFSHAQAHMYFFFMNRGLLQNVNEEIQTLRMFPVFRQHGPQVQVSVPPTAQAVSRVLGVGLGVSYKPRGVGVT